MKWAMILTFILSFNASADCNSPFPATPGNEAQSFTYEYSNDSAKFSLWYEDCGDGLAAVFLRVQVLSGNPFICGVSATVVQNNQQYNYINFYDDLGSRVCSRYFVDSTFAVGSGDNAFSQAHEFKFIYDDDFSVTLPPFSTSTDTANNQTSELAECEASYNPATDQLTIPCLDAGDFGKYTATLDGPFNVTGISTR